MLAEEPRCQKRLLTRPDRGRGGRSPAHRAARREAGRGHGGPDRERRTGPGRGDHRTRRAHRGPLSRPSARQGDRDLARHGAPPRGRVHRRHRRRPDSVRPPDRLAGFAGLAPVPRDSGRVRGNLHRPRRYHRGLLRACYLAAMASLRCCPVSQHYYQRKRNEGKSHIQAVLALARRRLNVRWAMIRDNTSYEIRPSIPTAA
ncbi:transposase [Streptomyces sp. MNP-20]|uniref:transposase n=1 Tax=Streptomyces sp. MNP-20 TaxID=2721165 RepID=UPI0035C7FB66